MTDYDPDHVGCCIEPFIVSVIAEPPDPWIPGKLPVARWWTTKPALKWKAIDEMEQPSITCPRCSRTSYNPNDIAQGYCGYCHWWTSDLTGMLNTPEVIAQAEAEGAIAPL